MPTKAQAQHAFQIHQDYLEAGRALGVPPGQAYLIATGVPADGGDNPTSTQGLVYAGDQPENPTTKPHVLEWITQRAKADAPMAAAAEGRDANPGPASDPEGDTDINTVLTRDHDRVDALLKQLKAIPGASTGGSPRHQARRESIADLVTVALSRHEAAEEEYLWPAVRSALPDGNAVADTALSQEQEGKDVLTRLGRADPSTEEFDELAEQLDTLASRHVAFEDRMLRALERALGAKERQKLGRHVAVAEGRAPTRPHHRSPKRPGAAVKAAGAMGAATDRLRDATGDRPADRGGRAPGDEERRGNGDQGDQEES